MSGGSTTTHWQKPTTGNKRTEKVLLIVNITWVGGWKTKFWEVIMKRGKGPSPKGKGSHTKRKHKETSTDLCGKTYQELKSCKQSYTFFFCLGFGKIRNLPLTGLLRETGKDGRARGLTHLWTKQEKLQAEVEPPRVQASAIKHKMNVTTLLSKLHPLCKHLGHICERPDAILLYQTWNMMIQHSHLSSGEPQWLHAGRPSDPCPSSLWHPQQELHWRNSIVS